MTAILWFDGQAAYAVSGVMAKWIPDGDSLNLLRFLNAKEVNPVHSNWYNALCIVDGPFQNTVGKRIEEWGHWLDARGEQNEAAIIAAVKAVSTSSGTSITDADAAKIAAKVIAEIAS